MPHCGGSYVEQGKENGIRIFPPFLARSRRRCPNQTNGLEREDRGGGEEKKKRLHYTEVTHFLTMTLISAEKKGGGESGKNIPEVLWFTFPLSSLFQKTEGGMKEQEEPHLFLNKSGETLTVSAGIFTAKTSSRNLHINGGCKNIAENCNVQEEEIKGEEVPVSPTPTTTKLVFLPLASRGIFAPTSFFLFHLSLTRGRVYLRNLGGRSKNTLFVLLVFPLSLSFLLPSLGTQREEKREPTPWSQGIENFRSSSSIL